MRNFKGKLQKLFEEDQRDRKKLKLGSFGYAELERRDSTRRNEVKKIVEKSSDAFDGKDCFNSATVLLHSTDLTDLNLARKIATRCLTLGYRKSSLLLKIVEDKTALAMGLEQKHGTQRVKRTRT